MEEMMAFYKGIDEIHHGDMEKEENPEKEFSNTFAQKALQIREFTSLSDTYQAQLFTLFSLSLPFA